jgi:hypothetical protein
MIRPAIRKLALPSCMVAAAIFWMLQTRLPGREANDVLPGTRGASATGAVATAPAITARAAATTPVPIAGVATPVKAADAGREHHRSRPPAEARLTAAAGMVVARDPETGELGLPSPEQMRAIHEQRAEILRTTPEGFTEIRRADGAVGLLMNGRLQSYSVARIGADGRPVYQCVSAASDTAAVTRAPAPALEER